MDELTSEVLTIKKYSVNVIEVPFHSPVHLPFGDIYTRPSVWLKIVAEIDGIDVEGAAEGTALPMSIPMYDDTSFNIKENTSRIIDNLGRSTIKVSDAIKIIGNMDLLGNFATARMTVESAILDVVARARNRSIVSYLDNKPSGYERHIPYGKSIAESSEDRILAAAQLAFNHGAKRLKFKLSPNNYEELYPALLKVLQTYPGVTCMVDANGMFDPEDKDHIKMLKSIDSLDLLTIEEPVSRAGRLSGLEAHRKLASVLKLRTPITMDDAIKSLDDARQALSEGIADIVNLKPGRMGSFIKCIEIANYARAKNKEVMVGGMFEATPGRMMTLSLAAYCAEQGFKIPGDVSLPQERLSADLVGDRLRLSRDNDIVFKPSIGWGYTL